MGEEKRKGIGMADDTSSGMEVRSVLAPEAWKDYDTPEKELEDYPDVFSDIINALIYQGSDIVKPCNLRPAAVETRYLDLGGKLKRQIEDLAKYEVIDGKIKVLFLLANQSTVDRRMILRKCGYMGGYYRSQYNGQTNAVYPVMELVLYWGEKRWRSAGSIRRFFRKQGLPEEAWRFIDNEKLHVFEMRHLSKETIKRFTGDMRIILEFLSDDPDESCFAQKIKHTWAVRELLLVLLGNGRYRELEKGFEENNVCEKPQESEEGECTMRDWIGEAWDKGMKQGKVEGMISTCRDFGASFEETARKVKEKFGLEDEEVQKDMALYW